MLREQWQLAGESVGCIRFRDEGRRKGRLLTGREKYEGREGSLGRQNKSGKGVGWGRVDPLGDLAQLGIGPYGGKWLSLPLGFCHEHTLRSWQSSCAWHSRTLQGATMMLLSAWCSEKLLGGVAYEDGFRLSSRARTLAQLSRWPAMGQTKPF